jgi:DNA-binding CsgD family transcriptional regulator/tetratricopeptide (TPR) repeat protein
VLKAAAGPHYSAVEHHRDLIAERAALDPPNWVAAQAAQEAAIAAGGGGEAYQGLAIALFWQNKVDRALRAMERAYALYQRQGEHGPAAWAALWLAGQYSRLKGNPAVASGWIARCERVIARAQPSAEIGRVILVRALATNDPAEIETAAERAMEIARRFGDSDYEALALAHSGLAMLSLGRLKEGRARLDEAMAATTSGEVRAPEAVGQIYCALLAGCERTVDFQRAEQWSHVAQPFLEAYDQVAVTGTCRATYAGVLAATGYWSEAERELLHALRIFDGGARGMRADAIVRLADLRIRQGRLDDAAHLLKGNEGHPDAQQPLAELELARGRPRVAAALLERRLHQLSESNLQAAPILLRLVEAQIACSNLAAARSSATALAKLATLAGGDCLQGLAGLATGLVIAAAGEDPAAELDAALAHLEQALMRWEAARARLAVAEAAATPNPELAIREARLAMLAFTALGALPGADRARSLLRRLGVRTAGGPQVKAGLSRREEDVARLVGLGLSNDQIAKRLFLSPRTIEHHITSILRKLPASGRAEIAAHAVRHLSSDSS